LLTDGSDGFLVALHGKARLDPLGAAHEYGADAAIIRYQSKMENVVFGEKFPFGYCWHTDSYEKRAGQWQIVWARATTIQP